MNSDKVVSVTYVVSAAFAPPLDVEIPNGDGDWKWQNGLKQCQKVDLRWAANPSWLPVSPINYEVFNENTSWGYIAGTFWDSNFTVNMGEKITLGVRAIFPGGDVSQIQEVTYACFADDLVFWGSVVK